MALRWDPDVIVTERLTLRLPKAADVEDIHRIFCDEQAMTYWSAAAHRSIAETAAWLQPIWDDPVSSQFDYFIEFNGRIVGKLGCWRVPEVGFALNRAYWGQGIAEEGLQGFIGHMRTVGVCDHLFADVDPRNHSSRRLLEKCGFRHIGFEKNALETHIGRCDSDYFRLEL